jgi:fumarate reductase subunit D
MAPLPPLSSTDTTTVPPVMIVAAIILVVYPLWIAIHRTYLHNLPVHLRHHILNYRLWLDILRDAWDNGLYF